MTGATNTQSPISREAVTETRKLNGRFDLLSVPILKRVVKHRAFQFVPILVNLFVFAIVILSGIFGTPVGNRNFSIIFVWIVWWAILIILLIPFASRIWCTMCPIPAVGEWVQRKATVERRKSRPLSLNLEWPSPLRNIWIQNFAFLGVAMFSAIVLTRPIVTGVLLLGFMVIALALFLTYKRRVFCRYVCPVGGFVGLYSMVAPLEVRAKDPNLCLRHCNKECIRGSKNNYGCPWMEYPGTLNRNAYCGMCTECIKACPMDNVTVYARPFGTDLLVPKRHLDEAYKGFIMLAAAVVYSVVMLGPWGWIKDAANLGTGSIPKFIGYAASLIGVTLVLVPGVFLVFTWLSKLMARTKDASLLRLFTSYGYAAVPIGLMGWIAFSFSFVFINSSYAIPVVADPFGWGWNILGLASYPWTPYIPQVLPLVQVPTLILGLVLSIMLAHRISIENFGDTLQARRSLIPVAVFLVLVTLVFLRLYLG